MDKYLTVILVSVILMSAVLLAIGISNGNVLSGLRIQVKELNEELDASKDSWDTEYTDMNVKIDNLADKLGYVYADSTPQFIKKTDDDTYKFGLMGRFVVRYLYE